MKFHQQNKRPKNYYKLQMKLNLKKKIKKFKIKIYKNKTIYK